MVDFSIKNRSKRGFTLVELLFTIIIIGIFASAGMSLYYDANVRSKNAVRDNDIRSIVSSSTFMKTSTGRYPTSAIDFSSMAKNFISEIPFDPDSSRNIALLGQPLPSYSTTEYTFSFYDFPVLESEDRVLASAFFESDSNLENPKNRYFGRYFIGTMTGPTSHEMWSQGVNYSVGQTNAGTILLR